MSVFSTAKYTKSPTGQVALGVLTPLCRAYGHKEPKRGVKGENMPQLIYMPPKNEENMLILKTLLAFSVIHPNLPKQEIYYLNKYLHFLWAGKEFLQFGQRPKHGVSQLPSLIITLLLPHQDLLHCRERF